MSTAAVATKPNDLLHELTRLPTTARRRRLLARNQSRITFQLIVELADHARQLLRIDARQSLSLAEIAIEGAGLLADPVAIAHAARSKANAYYALGRYRPALKLYGRAIRLFDRPGQATELARTLSVSILSLTLCGKYKAAFRAADRARGIFAQQKDDLRLARLDINVGNIYYRQDRFAQALELYKRAYPVVLGGYDAEAVGVVLSNLAVCLISLGEFSQALNTYKEARDACHRHNMPRLVAQADYNIGYLFYLRGEYSRAIDMLRATRVACQKVGDRYHHALCNLDLSEIYLELNLSVEAGELARAAHSEFKGQGLGYETAKALAFEAIALGQQENSDGSLKVFKRARAIFVTEKNQVWPSLIDLYRALVLFNAGRYTAAHRLARSALDFFDLSPLPGKAALCRLLLARIAQATGDLSKARCECLAAMEKLKELQSPMLRYQTFLLMGQIESTGGNREQAYSWLRASRRALETLRGNVRGPELTLSFVKNRLAVYELLVDECLRKASESSLQEAFAYIEEAKSRILIDQMRQSDGKVSAAGRRNDLLERIASLRDELNWYYRLIELEQLRPQRRSREYLRQLEIQVHIREKDLVRSLRECSLSDGFLSGAEPQEDAIYEEPRTAISEKTVVVEYFQSGDRILACLVTRDRLDIVPVTCISRIDRELGLLKFQLAKFRLGASYAEVFAASLIKSVQSHLRRLYDELLAPIRARIEGEHLVIVPHGALHYLPFHAFFDGDRYIIDDYTVSYAPSLGVYALCTKKAVNLSGPTLLMGIPDQRAPLIEEEIQAIRSIWPNSKTVLGTQATGSVLRNEGPSCRILHIATHGYFRQDSPLFSSIRLGDSFLSLYDLYHLKLPAELVTLSGCGTGMNAVSAGDELIGLARGLFQAGAQSLLLSLWDAHDASTAKFMQTFYRRLRRGMTKAAALKQAMLEVRERYPHPYQWAPFVLMGGYGSLSGA